MVLVTDFSDLSRIANPAIRKLVSLRLQQLSLPCDLGTAPVEWIVVEAGDSVPEIEEIAGFPILTSLFDELPYTDPDFQPCSEILEEHRNEDSCIYEMVFEGSGDGAVACFIPEEDGIDANLLLMLRMFATPAVSTA